MHRRFGWFFGAAFLFGGALGFVPGVIQDDMYLGLFMVNTPHSILHLASGALFLLSAMAGDRVARIWLGLFGLFYGAMAAIGFSIGDGMILGLIMNNWNDAFGHAILSALMLAITAIPASAVSRSTASSRATRHLSP
jgi:Domain of unknown function (DUF4383)